jgi:hypothetical protein
VVFFLIFPQFVSDEVVEEDFVVEPQPTKINKENSTENETNKRFFMMKPLSFLDNN